MHDLGSIGRFSITQYPVSIKFEENKHAGGLKKQLKKLNRGSCEIRRELNVPYIIEDLKELNKDEEIIIIIIIIKLNNSNNETYKKLRKRRSKETRRLFKQQTDLFTKECQEIEQSCKKVSNRIFQNTVKTIFGKNYIVEALDRMNKRSISFYSTENAMNQGIKHLLKNDSWLYKYDNVIVNMNKDHDNVLTTYWDLY
ncbi:hypothetical protein PIROE2DRAFT_13022 [Piromyces sp. E2]|nr:hypothetical protein PIROE2DRAFT_13022 [Piromyces sp. E2]|eukprot:OUM61068.1 hypothetical protein PIROE2DRAFT_13022 [Piromyces sp. E2]